MEKQFKVDIDMISSAPWRECECGGMLFTNAVMVKKMSAIISPDGKEHNIPIDILVCNDCKKIPGFIHETSMGIPDSVKSQKTTPKPFMPG